jgi:hypothetical protein
VLVERTVFAAGSGTRIESRLKEIDASLYEGGPHSRETIWNEWASKLEWDMVRGSDGVLVTHYPRQGRFSRASTAQQSPWDSAPGILRRIPELASHYLSLLPARLSADQVHIRDGRVRVVDLPSAVVLEFEPGGSGYRLSAVEQALSSSGRRNRWDFVWSEGRGLSRRALKVHGDDTELLAEDVRASYRILEAAPEGAFTMELGESVMHNPRTGELTDASGRAVGRVNPERKPRSYSGIVLIVGVGLVVFGAGLYIKSRWGR